MKRNAFGPGLACGHWTEALAGSRIALALVSLMLVLTPVRMLVRFLAEGAVLHSVTATSSDVAGGYQAAIVGLPDLVQTQ